MTLAEARAMPIGQKFQLMEILWQDMREQFEAAPVSDEIKALLDRRRDPHWIAARLMDTARD